MTPVNLTTRDRLWNRSKLWRIEDKLRERKAKPPRESLWFLLSQGYIWIGKHGEEYLVEEMRLSHCRNLINYLHRRAPRLKRIHEMKGLVEYLESCSRVVGTDIATGRPVTEAEFFRSDRAEEDWERELWVDPIEWIDQFPLLRALRERVGV